MEKLTFGIQIIIGIILIIIANVLSFVLHNGIFSNISWVIYGLLFIINPVYPERYGNSEKKAKLGVRIAGIICIAVFVLLMAIVYLGAKSGKLQHFLRFTRGYLRFWCWDISFLPDASCFQSAVNHFRWIFRECICWRRAMV